MIYLSIWIRTKKDLKSFSNQELARRKKEAMKRLDKVAHYINLIQQVADERYDSGKMSEEQYSKI
jgi:hypothetical protein